MCSVLCVTQLLPNHDLSGLCSHHIVLNKYSNGTQMAPRTRSQTASISDSFATLFRLRSSAEPPVYRIDLSLPPKERYSQICSDFKPELACLQGLWHDIISISPFPPKIMNFLASITLRRLFSKEQHEEIIGISKASGIPTHVVVAFNTLLDLFCACTSGGVRVNDAGPDQSTHGIIHFRTLDWEMEPLRDMTICVEYIREGRVLARYAAQSHSKLWFEVTKCTVARALTYAGFVGVLTGVRWVVFLLMLMLDAEFHSGKASQCHWIIAPASAHLPRDYHITGTCSCC